MRNNWELLLVVAATTAAAINAGAFFAFSNFVMPALGDEHPASAASAMQSINRFAPSFLFVATIMGAGVVAAPVLISERATFDTPTTQLLAAAVILSVLSTVITMGFNVPRNNALDAADAATMAGQECWRTYLVSWTRWNTVRTVLSLASTVLFALSLRGR